MADGDLKLSDSPNVDEGYVEVNGSQHRVVLTAIPEGTLELSDNPNVDTGYIVDSDNKKHKVKLTAQLSGSDANADLSNLSDEGKNIANWSSNISNCLIDVPQDIKIELSEGTLTLKSGSKLYVANGDLNVTDTTTADISITNSNGGQYLVIRNSATSLYVAKTRSCLSGTIANRPSSLQDNAGLYFATDEKKMYLTGNGGSAWYHTTDYTLPIAIITVSSGAISSIDQVFNGFGYIGSTRFFLPGVSVLYADGRNDDGTLKTGIYTRTSVYTSTYGDTINGVRFLSAGPDQDAIVNYYEQTTAPATNCLWYNPETNLLLRSTDNGATWVQRKAVVVAKTTSSSGIISALEVLRQPFHILGYDDVLPILKSLSGFDASKTQTLKNVQGVVSWVDDE